MSRKNYNSGHLTIIFLILQVAPVGGNLRPTKFNFGPTRPRSCLGPKHIKIVFWDLIVILVFKLDPLMKRQAFLSGWKGGKHSYRVSGVPASNFLFAGRVLVNNFLNAGWVLENNLFLSSNRLVSI